MMQAGRPMPLSDVCVLASFDGDEPLERLMRQHAAVSVNDFAQTSADVHFIGREVLMVSHAPEAALPPKRASGARP